MLKKRVPQSSDYGSRSPRIMDERGPNDECRDFNRSKVVYVDDDGYLELIVVPKVAKRSVHKRQTDWKLTGRCYALRRTLDMN